MSQILKESTIKFNLLRWESLNFDLPKVMYNEERGTFDIPFKTEKFRNWVSYEERIHSFYANYNVFQAKDTFTNNFFVIVSELL